MGNVLGMARNAAVDVIDSVEIAKYNFMKYAGGEFTHPILYEW